MTTLKQFPNKIAKAETKVLNLDREIKIHKENLSFMCNDLKL